MSGSAEAARYETLIRPLLRIPSRFRDFTVPEHDVQMRYGLDPETLAALRDVGLPVVSRDRAEFYEHADLHFAGLRLGTAHLYLYTIRLWARTLRDLARSGPGVLRVAVIPQLADRGCLSGHVQTPAGEVEATLRDGEPSASFDVELQLSWTLLPKAIRRHLVAEAELEFYDLRTLVEAAGGESTAAAAGITSCGLASLRLGRLLVEEGYRCRGSSGLLVAFPYSTEHAWLEVEVDGVWSAIDPVIVALMQRYGGLDPADWPVYRAVNGMLVRLGDGPQALVAAGRTRVPATFLTTSMGSDARA
jgi:hypothetical protein